MLGYLGYWNAKLNVGEKFFKLGIYIQIQNALTQ